MCPDLHAKKRISKNGRKTLVKEAYHSYEKKKDHSFDNLIAARWEGSVVHVWGPIPMEKLREKGLVKTDQNKKAKTTFYVHKPEGIQGICKALTRVQKDGYKWTQAYLLPGSVDCKASLNE